MKLFDDIDDNPPRREPPLNLPSPTEEDHQRQLVLLCGLDCLPGQLDLFPAAESFPVEQTA